MRKEHFFEERTLLVKEHYNFDVIRSVYNLQKDTVNFKHCPKFTVLHISACHGRAVQALSKTVAASTQPGIGW